MIDTEAFREFKQALTFLRDNYPIKALPHMRRAVELDTHNPYYRSYLGVVVARAERKWAEAEELCDTAVRMKRNQAQLYLNLAEVYGNPCCGAEIRPPRRPVESGPESPSRAP